jgi:chromosome partitioning protein
MSYVNEPTFIADFQHFEQHVAKLFVRGGWTVETAKTNQPGYDLIVRKDKYIAAVQIKWLKSNVSTPQILKFVDFLETKEGKTFNVGFFITTKGFGGPGLGLIKGWGKNTKVYCGVASESKISWINPTEPFKSKTNSETITNNPKKIYFGIFTCKGGVGKTTIAAHLAGAFVLQEFNVALVDLDPEQNLHKLVGDGVYIPNSQGGVGHSIEVFSGKDWDENAAKDAQIVICDCSPALERNPIELIEKLDYCIIPTTLNPLGISKHGRVIEDTVNKLRKINKNSHLFVLINNFKNPGTKRLQLLKDIFVNVYQNISKTDEKFDCIDPEEACIRSSDLLYYWGIHLLEDPDNPRSELAFNLVGGRCHPKEDFLNVADYIEAKAGLGSLRE